MGIHTKHNFFFNKQDSLFLIKQTPNILKDNIKVKVEINCQKIFLFILQHVS